MAHKRQFFIDYSLKQVIIISIQNDNNYSSGNYARTETYSSCR